ncbi:MAG: hypothetical protein JKY99_06450 [Rhizobiales bacterium]|nr:hypothetical protein [Hyphomicrobiales bacterium]
MLDRVLPERLRPLAAKHGLLPLYGDIHNHCNLSYGHGDLESALKHAAVQLDFVSITGHAYWPDMPVDDPSVKHIVDFHVEGFAKLRRNWLPHYETLEAFDAPGQFTVFPGYEIHSFEHGDYTIVYEGLTPQGFVLADSPAELLKALRGNVRGGFMAFPHHIGYRQGARGINWDSFVQELSPVVEMFSMHGCAENSVTDRPYLHSMGPSNGTSTMVSGLAQGHIFGIVGNTDHHSAYPGSYGHGRCCAYACSNQRGEIWGSLMGRRTNALTGDKIHLLGAIGEAVQGGILPPQPNAVLDIEAVGGGFIDTIDVIRNGQLFQRISPEIMPSPIDKGGDAVETVLVLEMGWGARHKTHRWVGNITIENGEILNFEPRLRGAEIVSPLEGEDAGDQEPQLSADKDGIRFEITAHANPNNVTAATQAIAVRVRLEKNAVVTANLNGTKISVAAEQLFTGALSGNLGPIDSPAYRFHQLPAPRQWQWQGQVPLGAIVHGENIYLKLRQSNGQMAWTSPLFCREI